MRLVFTALFGLAIGSFLNVVIARVPERRSLLRPPSSCPCCGVAIAWYDNIPLASFIALRGRCRACRMAIPWTYPLVELASGAGFVIALTRFGATWDFAIAAVLISTLIAVTVIDLRHQIIPDVITLPGILAGLLANLGTGRLPWTAPILGILVGGGVFYAIGKFYEVVMKQEGMGGGDMKLAALLGAFLGWKLALFAFFVGALLGGPVALVLMALGVRSQKDPVPFGPFLAAGGVVALLWGERIIRWYVSAFSG